MSSTLEAEVEDVVVEAVADAEDVAVVIGSITTLRGRLIRLNNPITFGTVGLQPIETKFALVVTNWDCRVDIARAPSRMLSRHRFKS